MRARALALLLVLPAIALSARAQPAPVTPPPSATASAQPAPSGAPTASPGPSASPAPDAPAGPSQEDRERANALMDEGDDRADKGDHAAALVAYEKAHAIMHVPTTGIEVAKTLDKLGKLTAALAAAREVASTEAAPGEPRPFAEARAQAAALVTSLEARVPTLAITITVATTGSRAEVSLGDKKLTAADLAAPLRLDPGRYKVSATAPDHTPASVEITLKERDRAQAALALARIPIAPLPPPPPRPAPEMTLSPLVPAGFSIAGAGVLAGAITGALAISAANQANNLCDDGRCPSESTRKTAQDRYDAADALAIASDVSFVVALGGAVMGIYGVVLTTSPTPAKQAPSAISSAKVLLGPGRAAVRFTF